jgi:glycosyltransferase involved in cell wall biosynthesis
MVRSRVAIAIPAFNEEKTIFSIVKSAKKHGQVIVVDDGSTDKTAEKAKKGGAIVLIHKINKGYDEALNSAFIKAIKLKFKYFITFDADGQHDIKLLKDLINLLETGVPIVLGVREKKARIAEKIFALYTKQRFGIQDPLCGLKGYNLSYCKHFKFFDTKKSLGTELMLKTISSGLLFKEVNFKINKRNDESRIGSLFISNLKILRYLFIWIFKN